jgi:DNA polymerase III subunit chi
MQVDFYQLTRDPAEKILTSLAQKALADRQRLLVVSAEKTQLSSISAALWGGQAESFLAHSMSGQGEDDAIQPILLSDVCIAANGAELIAIADGQWRDDALAFGRVFYLFAPDRTDDARAAWRKLGESEAITRKYWKQDGGRWIEGP